jgi:hypothetical protein
MSVATWQRLVQLETDITTEFTNKPDIKACPAGPRVHLVFAHYAARPDVDRAMQKWKFPTLDAYGKTKEPHYQQPALDYLASHFLWVACPNVLLTEVPNLASPVEKTASEGGTLIHLLSTNCDKATVPAKVAATAKIPNFDLVDGYAAPAPAGGGATPATPAGGATPARPGGGATPATATSTAATPAATTDTVTPEGATYPTLRRLCLSIPGDPGSHKDVDISGTTVTAVLDDYGKLSEDGEMRLLAISPGFNFTVGGNKIAMTDPWTTSTYHASGTKPSGTILESSSGVSLGGYTSDGDAYGLAKTSGNLTRTTDLGARYRSQMGASREVIFKGMRDVEGPAECVQTWEPNRMSWGINQWQSDNELWQILAFISDFFPKAFARRFGYFGFGIWFSGRKATWNFGTTYTGVVPYRVPCCGQTTRSGIAAIYSGAKTAAPAANAKAPTAAETAAANDKPPAAQEAMANAFKFPSTQYQSFAFAYVLTAAGADQEIQKAQAQWMSYRITSVHTRQTMTNKEVLYAFLADLRARADVTADREATSLRTLQADPAARGLINATFSDADAGDQEWVSWPTRCKNANKSTTAVAAQQQTHAPAKNPKARKP